MKSLMLVAIGLFIFSCAHHRDVRPNSSGKHLVKFNTEYKSSGYQNAKSQADHFCEKKKENSIRHKRRL